MMGKEIDPSDIGKHPKIIRAAQNDMTQTDVLVCGKCHSIFHFIELFQEHKDLGCDRDSEFKDNKESKPKVWAFLLWKAAQLSTNETSGNGTNSWKLYQQWVKMDESVRETWIVAGRTIQSFARMGQGNLQEMPVKITKTVVDSSSSKLSSLPKAGQRIIDNKQIFKKEVNTDNEEDLSPIRPDQSRLIRKPINQINQIKAPIGNTIVNKTSNRRANRTVPNGQEIEEETVEKIIAKRFNPRRKMHEYLVKWEGYPHGQNTWEPQTHLESCPQLLDTFEKQLARQKEQRAAQAAKQASQSGTTTVNQAILPLAKDMPLSPSRQNMLARNALKPRAPDLKSWTSQEEILSNSTKRKLDESEEFDGSGATEDNTDLDDNGAPTSKRLRNGNAILRMDSSGEIKISQSPTTPLNRTVNGTIKSVNNDSSAEVIITKDNQSSGIVKKAGVLATNTQKSEAQVRVLSKGENTSSGIVRINKVQPSGIAAGQTRITQISNQRDTATQRTLTNSLNTSPRLSSGQTRIVQRTTISPNINHQATKAIINRVAKQQPEPAKAITPEQKIIQLSQKNDLKVTRKIVHSTAPQSLPLQQHRSPQQQINRLPISNDLPDDPFPEPQSPPRPLTLCPVTGKVLGQAEGEPSPVPSPEPERKENNVPQLANQRANITSIGILQTDHPQGNAAEMQQEMALAAAEDEQAQHLLTSEDGTPLLVKGDDGTIYQVAGKNAEGQTILIAQGADGEQQFAYVAAEEGDESGVLTLDNAVAEAVAQMLPEQQAEAFAAAAAAASGGETQFILKQEGGPHDGSTESGEALTIQTGDGGDSQDGNIPAEVVQADLPSPGGTRRVVLLLQDGTFMMTEMHDDEYQALNIVT